MKMIFGRKLFAAFLCVASFSILVQAQTSGIDLDSGLAGHWTMNDGTGNMASDSSGFARHGTLIAGPVWVSQKFNGGLRFDGVDDYVDVPDAPQLNPTSALTMATWFNSADISAGGILISKGTSGDQFHLRIFAGSVRVRLTTGGNMFSYEPAYSFTSGAWYHLAAVYDGTNLVIYVNGSPIGKPYPASGSLYVTSVNLNLGKRSGAFNNYFNGVLDDVRIYSRALSAREIATLASITDDRSWDFGDAPEPPYPTTAASDGARHAVGGLYLGASVGPESDGKPSLDANGDGAEDDGVAFLAPISPGAGTIAAVTVSMPCLLDAWIDFEGNGAWDAPGEQIFSSTPLAAGLNSVVFSVPATARIGATYARFRISTAGGLAPTGAANDGEVEDYPVEITLPVLNTNTPVITYLTPAANSALTGLTNIVVSFSELVLGVDAADLLVNGVPAMSVSGNGSNYTFAVVEPGPGPVVVGWASGHGILDLGAPLLAFDENAPGATWGYTIVDLTPPTVVAKNPPANALVTNFTQIDVTFSEEVLNVQFGDFLVNNSPAIRQSGGGSNYTFYFAQPPPGIATIAWASSHGITDLSSNAFNGTGAGAFWSYMVRAPASNLVASIARLPDGTNALLSFPAAANASYSIEFVYIFDGSPWQTAQNIPSAPSNRTIQVVLPASRSSQFYRLRAP
jgi:hypothetical protein